MLNSLHEQIDKIVKIHGVSENEDGTYRVDYNEQPSESQLSQISIILREWPLYQKKEAKIVLLNNKWKEVISGGWTTPYGWRLGLETQDIALLNGAFTLAKEAVSMGLSTGGTIVDTDGLSHELPLDELTVLMLQYGQARSLLSADYSKKLREIKSATSTEELDNILV